MRMRNPSTRHLLPSGSIARIICAVCLAASSVAGDVRVVVRTLDHEGIRGELIEFGLTQGLILHTLEGDDRISLPYDEVVEITNLSAKPTGASGLCVILTNGDKLYGTVSGSGPDQMILDTLLGPRLAIPLDRVRACLTSKAREPRWRSAAQRMMKTDGTDEDRALMSNGDVMKGLVVGIEPRQILFESGDRELSLDLDLVVALALAGEPYPIEPGPRARLTLIDGSVLTVSRLHWVQAAVELTFFDGTLQGVPPEAIRAVEVSGGRWTWLATLPPSSFKHTPMLTLNWPYTIDQNVLGDVLSIGGRKFKHGIGVHSRAVMSFDLGGRYREFTTYCGLDDSAGPLAGVTAVILVDGKTKWQKERIRAGFPPESVRIDIQGAQTLELRVEFGENGDIQDRFDWADAALIR